MMQSSRRNFGVIVTLTAAEGKNTAELHEDLSAVDQIRGKLSSDNLKGTACSPVKILSEQIKTTSILRDLLTEDFNKIVINDRNVYQ